MARTVGAKNKVTRKREIAMEQAADEIVKLLPKAFKGDAHTLLMTVYKNPDHEMPLRVDAAKAAIRYEKPALSQIDANHSGSIDVRSWLSSLGESEK